MKGRRVSTSVYLTPDQQANVNKIMTAEGYCLCGRTLAPDEVPRSLLSQPYSHKHALEGEMKIGAFCRLCYKALNKVLSARRALGFKKLGKKTAAAAEL